MNVIVELEKPLLELEAKIAGLKKLNECLCRFPSPAHLLYCMLPPSATCAAILWCRVVSPLLPRVFGPTGLSVCLFESLLPLSLSYVCFG